MDLICTPPFLVVGVRGRVKKIWNSSGNEALLIFTTFFRGRPIFFRGKTNILGKSSGVKVILLIFRGRKKTEVLKTGKGGSGGGGRGCRYYMQ